MNLIFFKQKLIKLFELSLHQYFLETFEFQIDFPVNFKLLKNTFF